MRKTILALALLILPFAGLLSGCSPGTHAAVVTAADGSVAVATGTSTFTFGRDGSLAAIRRKTDGVNFVVPGQPSPVLQLNAGGKDSAPDSASFDNGVLTLRYAALGAVARVAVKAKETHVSLELVSVDSPKTPVDMVRWGPYPTTLGGTIGELIGIVREGGWAVGIQALNARTQGGEPNVSDGWESHRYNAPDGAHDGLAGTGAAVLHLGTTAKAAPFGSLLQMHCFEHERSDALFPLIRRSPCANLAPRIPMRYPGETVTGTKVALFACPEDRVLPTLENIELTEGLPHVMIRGKWGKSLKGTDLIHLCFEFGEDTIDDFIAVAKKAGIPQIYHNSPWATWGHFPPKPGMFPHGYDGMKACVDKAHAAGLSVGAHTLSGFITADDKYVAVPGGHPDLARVAGPDSGHIVTKYGKHIYYGNRKLVTEIMKHCAWIVSHCGFDQWEMDGLESNNSMGLGGYGRDLMLDTWRNALSPEKKDRVILGSSAMDNYALHLFYGGCWGEPWRAAFRDAMLDYRLAMVRFQARNYLPRMLGQYFIHPQGEKVEDIEWLMAVSTGYDAGFSLTFDAGPSGYMHGEGVSHREWLRPPNVDACLDVIRRWRKAQRADAFPPEVKRMLQDPKREFRLEETGDKTWNLYPVVIQDGKRVKGEAIPLTGRSS